MFLRVKTRKRRFFFLLLTCEKHSVRTYSVIFNSVGNTVPTFALYRLGSVDFHSAGDGLAGTVNHFVVF